jgi:tetratricopeptide (TPR) repeat protein
LFLKGEKEPAIELQQNAVELAEGGRKRQFQRNLDDYKAGRVPNEAQIAGWRRQIDNSIREKEWDKAASTLDELEKLLLPEEREDLGMTRFRILLGRKDYKNAYQLAARLSDAHQDEAMFQNQLAWEIATNEDLEERDLDLAEKIARRANDATKGTNAEILDTLARVLFLKGQKEPAIQFQQKAVDLAKGRRKSQFQATLDSYRKGTLPKSY